MVDPSLTTTMSSTTINCLPPEVLEMVLDFLPCSDRKSASLVSHRWLQAAFSSRFLNKVNLLVPSSRRNVDRIQLLLASKRPYRNFFISTEYGRCGPDDWRLLVQFLERFAGSVTCFQSMVRFTPVLVKAIRERLPGLKEICVGVSGDVACCQCSIVGGSREAYLGVTDVFTLERQLLGVGADVDPESLPNVVKLALRINVYSNTNYDFNVLGRVKDGLREMYIYSKESYIPMEYLKQRKVRVMLMSGSLEGIDENIQMQFNEELSVKRQAYPTLEVTLPLLQVITSTCSRLTTLRISTNWLSQQAVRYLDSLDQLEELYVFGDFHKTLLRECAPLPTVKTLILRIEHIDTIDQFFETIAKITPNLCDLRVLLPPPCILDNAMAELICRNFRMLRKLALFGSMMAPVESRCDTFVHFDQMPFLEELIVRDMYLNMERLMPGKLRILRINYCRSLRDEDLQLVPLIFPKLKVLEIGFCANVTKPAVQALIPKMPGCSLNAVIRIDG